MYTPYCWVVLKMSNEKEVIYKVLGGWSGGYLDSDSWRINSGIKSVEMYKSCNHDSIFYDFEGYSGSVYRCHEGNYGIKMSTAGIYQTLVEQASTKEGVSIELMPEDTDWLELFNEGGDL